MEQHESLLTFEQLLVAIVAALERVEREGSSDAAQKASGHLAAITRFDFLISLEMAVLLFGITLGLSVCLSSQNPQQSLSDAMKTNQPSPAGSARRTGGVSSCDGKGSCTG